MPTNEHRCIRPCPPWTWTLALAALCPSLAAVAADPEPPVGNETASVVNFTNDLIPVFTKHGCNAGACHGAAIGRGTFKLSLFGGDPESDYQAIALEQGGRRVNLASPESSLVLLKPSESIAHEGGYLLEEDSEDFQLLHKWIRQGADWHPPKQLRNLELSPDRIVSQVTPAEIPISARAHYDDGSTRDVTDWLVLTSTDESAIQIDADTHTVTLLRPGRHLLVARFLDRVVPIELIAPLGTEGPELSGITSNLIDGHINQTLQTLGLPPSPQATDQAFERRITLDLTGRLPAASDDQTPVSREQLVESLLDSPEFIEYWTLKLATMLRIRPAGGRDPEQESAGAYKYHQWLAAQLTANVGFDQVVESLLLAEGDADQVATANFYRTTTDPGKQAEFVSELFMGTRLRCANCHNHPLDRWTQDDYHGLAAIFAQVSMGKIVQDKPRGEVIHPRTLESATPRLPGGRYLSANDAETPRQQFSAWLVAPDNPYFAKAIVNRLWKHMMGRGLVEPVDDFRSTNPATHPALLDALAKDFVNHGFDLRHTLRTIATSQTYARSALALEQNRDDNQFYSHFARKPLPAEVLADAISDVLSVPESYGDQPLGTRAVALLNPKTPSVTLDILGRCDREESCESTTMAGGGLPQMLHLMNGPLLNRRLSAPNSRLSVLRGQHKSIGEIVAHFYDAALNRKPSAAESTYWDQQLSDGDGSAAQAALEDFVWSLLSCDEFLTNH